MSYEMKDGDISVFKNDKQGNEKRPDFTGKCKINGEEYFVSLWLKQGQSGNKFLSGKIKNSNEIEKNTKTTKDSNIVEIDDIDDIPDFI